MYETREKVKRDYDWRINTARNEGLEKGREEGREEGREKGREEGLEKGKWIGMIRTCQMILSESQSIEESLREKPIAELQLLAENLQIALRKRNG